MPSTEAYLMLSGTLFAVGLEFIPREARDQRNYRSEKPLCAVVPMTPCCARGKVKNAQH